MLAVSHLENVKRLRWGKICEILNWGYTFLYYKGYLPLNQYNLVSYNAYPNRGTVLVLFKLLLKLICR